MRRLLLAVLLVGLAGGLAPAPVGAAGGGFSAYVACGHRPSAKPAHTCQVSDNPAAFFVSRKKHVEYKVCVKYPGQPNRLCAGAQDAPRGEKQRVTIATGAVGKHRVQWYVGGRQVGSWKFTVAP